ncbi:MAG: hypothetical protein LBT81_02575 [Helicobacteraceae bacterium]|nr:hypothetical protein [Helicobacteraceae bacterium]
MRSGIASSERGNAKDFTWKFALGFFRGACANAVELYLSVKEKWKVIVREVEIGENERVIRL